jgi:putative ATPase
MQDSLFYSQAENFSPLAEMMRPKSTQELIGSIKNNPAFINWLENGAKQSCVLWGPPGTGKTSIAELAAKKSNRDFIKLQAFNSGVKDLREIIQRAQKVPNSILLFVDEVHNFNKNQQDILLNAVEKGVLTFIGATTENPAISINRALLSRAIKFELNAHSYSDLSLLVDRALSEKNVSIEDDARDHLIKSAFGDARALLTNLELLLNNSTELIETKRTQQMLGKKLFAGDPNSYYDCVSALQKSMRGSDVDASIYWLARLLSQGAELKSVARRILVTAAEDVGIADPQALVIANAAFQAATNLGMPEARIPLAQAVVYVAKAPKSNHAYKALDKAMRDCQNHPPYAIPMHLRNIQVGEAMGNNSGVYTQDCPAKSENKGINPSTQYKYPHDYPDGIVEQQYLPDELVNKKYFDPSSLRSPKD